MQLLKFTNFVSVFFLLISFFFGLYLYTNPSSLLSHSMAENTSKSIYDFTVKDIRGNDVSLSEYNGKVLLIVNVASKCGLTQTNYKELNVLYEKYKNQGFEILAFPCNQFLGQEPGNNEAIQEVACTMFKAEFPIFDKVEVNGKNAAPIYKFLKSQKGGILGDALKWNFTKFLLNKEGKVVERYAPTTSPLKLELIFVLNMNSTWPLWYVTLLSRTRHKMSDIKENLEATQRLVIGVVTLKIPVSFSDKWRSTQREESASSWPSLDTEIDQFRFEEEEEVQTRPLGPHDSETPEEEDEMPLQPRKG
ncbi:hypothetical protein SO802_021854 [Lithocarpus litseifolius]|uniref:Glutathione peroxidase n=1 Tax=Lithocarpus litseifolius TaxID=425828 RepID=A0AAW2CHH0_9ROSI